MTRGREFYEEIGQKGGQKVKELVEEGKEAEGQTGTRSESGSKRSSSSSTSRSRSENR
jgi:uncharacterized protein